MCESLRRTLDWFLKKSVVVYGISRSSPRNVQMIFVFLFGVQRKKALVACFVWVEGAFMCVRCCHDFADKHTSSMQWASPGISVLLFDLWQSSCWRGVGIFLEAFFVGIGRPEFPRH